MQKVTRDTLDPKIYYKYRDFNDAYHQKLLFEQEIFFSDIIKLNDPFEGVLPVQDLSEVSDREIIEANIAIQKYKNPYVWNQETANMMREYFENAVDSIRKRGESIDYQKKCQNEIRNLLNKSLGVFSLSCDPLCYLMWSHYANSHKGFCIGFDSLKLSKYLKPAAPILINYSNDMPVWRIGEDERTYLEKYLGTKGRLWEYEQEMRIIKSEFVNKSIKFGIEAIHSVFIGKEMCKDDELQIVDYLRKNHPLCHLYKIQFLDRKYDLEAVSIQYI